MRKRLRPDALSALFAALAAAVSSGCALAPRSDTARYYVLSTPAQTGPPPERAHRSIGVSKVSLPEYLNRLEIVRRQASNELVVSSFELWGEPLRDGFGRVLSTQLSALLGTDRVVAAPWDASHAPDLTLEVEVRRFELVGSEGAQLDAVWTLRPAGNGAPVATRHSVWRQPVETAETEAAVSALSRTIADLAADIAAAVHAHETRSSATR
jgi:uncharacterized lipoprotein YmbA